MGKLVDQGRNGADKVFLFRKPSGGNLYEWVRCSVCDFLIRTDRTPKGGRYTTNTKTNTINGTDVNYNDDRSGCPSCGSPWWDGGKAGDLMRPWR